MAVNETNANARSLEGISLLSSLSAEARQAIADKSSWRKFAERERIVEHGAAHTDVFFMVSGQAHVQNYSEAGRVIEYANINKGEVFGEFAAIDGLARSAWVMSIEPSLVAAMSGPAFLDLVTSNEALSLALLRKFTGIIRLSDERIANVSLHSAEQRVCLELIRMAIIDPDNPDGLLVTPVPKQTSLANVIGSSRETVARVISQLKRDGVIERTDAAIHVPSAEVLENRALLEA